LVVTRHCELYRKSIITALGAFDLKMRTEVFKKVDLTAIGADLDATDRKTIAFHLGQTMALIQGKECYTKSDLVEMYPSLNAYLYRKTTDLKALQAFKLDFEAATGRLQIAKNGGWTQIRTKATPTNFLEGETGVVLDVKADELVVLPPLVELGLEPSWPLQALSASGEALVVFKNNKKLVGVSMANIQANPNQALKHVSEDTIEDLYWYYYEWEPDTNTLTLLGKRHKEKLTLAP